MMSRKVKIMTSKQMMYDLPELMKYKSIIREAKKRAKKRLGGQMYSTKYPHGESKEDYDETLRDETRLELCEILRELADTIEYNTFYKEVRK